MPVIEKLKLKDKEKLFLKLRGAVTESGHTLGEFARLIGTTKSNLNEKLMGRREFTLIEVHNACALLGKKPEIFFEPKLHKMQF
jgi:hypothetical protein